MTGGYKKIKVCIISRSAYPLFNELCTATFGGAEVDLYLLAVELAKDDRFSVSFIVGDFKQTERVEYIHNVKIIRGYRITEPKVIQMLKLIFRMISARSNIYFQESASGGTGVIAMVCFLMRAKFVYRAASIIDCNKEFIRNNKIEGPLFALGLRLASLVMAQTDVQQSEFRRTVNINSIVIKNGIKIPQIFLKERGSILWVGRSEQLKQPDLFVDLSESFPDYQFVMVCPAANFNSVNMDKVANRIEGLKNIRLIKKVPFFQMDNYYKDAIIFINTSIYEGFPNTFVQSMANATPIVSLNVNPDGFLEKYNCGYCANGSMELLKHHVESLLNDQELRHQLSKDSYKYAARNHDIKKITDQYKHEFIKLIDD